MTILGEFALWISLPVALWGMVLGFAGGRTQRGDLVLSAERSVYAVFLLHLVASIGIIAAFVGDKFEYWYVASYSNRETGDLLQDHRTLGGSARIAPVLGVAARPVLEPGGVPEPQEEP